jgi:hypothetical protein
MDLDPHTARQFFSVVDHPEAGAARYPRVPFIVRDLPPVRRAPLFGQHSTAILGSLADKGDMQRG